MVKYAQENGDIILAKERKITIFDVIAYIEDIDSEVHRKLVAYINYRRQLFSNDYYADKYLEIARENRNERGYEKLLTDVIRGEERTESVSP